MTHTHLATVTWLLQIWLLRPCLIPITIPTPHSCTPIELSLESELLSSESLLLDSAESIWPISWRPTLLTFCGCVNVFWGEGHSIHTIYMYTHWNNKHTHTCSHMHITCKQTCKSHRTHKCLHNTHISLTHFQLVVMHQTRTNAHADTHCSLVKKRPLMKECPLTTFGPISCIESKFTRMSTHPGGASRGVWEAWLSKVGNVV